MNPILSKGHLERVIGYKIDEIENIISNLENYYYSFYRIKKDDFNQPKIKHGLIQKRKITPAKKELRNIQDIIQEKIFSNIPLIHNIKGGVKGISNIDNAKLHKGRKYRFQTDISNCFPSIDSKMVFNSLRSKGFSKAVSKIISKVCTYSTDKWYKFDCLPQGNPTSPFLANLVMDKIILRINNVSQDLDILLTTWLDDFTFSSDKDFKHLIPIIVSTITKSGIKVSRKKTTYRINKSVITGVVVGMSTLKVTDKFRRKVKSNLTHNQKIGRDNYKDNIYKSMKAGV